ncbi:MAG TPA: DUF4167 domain-containing protein [Xanthobacteraceae bacterium]|nr:DUF4167 domain-containing protein [Xanthobacteraceae bacterium]
MRNGQNKRMRGRNRSKGQNPLTRVYESNGPDVKIRGTASHIAEKYLQLARDAQSSGDPVAAENYFQHAEHYFRLIAAAQEQFRQNTPYAREGETRDVFDVEDEEASDQPIISGEPYAPREQPHPYSGPRQPQQNYPRERFQPREQPQPYAPRTAPQSAPEPDEQGDIDRLPAFVTGGAAPASQPATYGGNGHDGADRFPLHRRRRRRHGSPRENQPSGEPGDTQPSHTQGE